MIVSRRIRIHGSHEHNHDYEHNNKHKHNHNLKHNNKHKHEHKNNHKHNNKNKHEHKYEHKNKHEHNHCHNIPMGSIFVNSMSNCEVSMEPTTVGIQGGIIRPAARFSKSISLHM